MKKGLVLVLVSAVLIAFSIALAYFSIQIKYKEVVSFGYGSIAIPPSDWEDQYWAILTHGEPKAKIFFQDQLIYLNNVQSYTLNLTTYYTYIVYGYVQPYAYLSLFSLFLASVGALIGFEASVLYFQELKIGDLIKGYAVRGSLTRYFLKRLSNSVIALSLVFIVALSLEYVSSSKFSFSPLSGTSSHFQVSLTSLILTSLSYTSLLLSIAFISTIYLTSFLTVYGLTNPRIGRIMMYWKYLGSALASWVLAIIILYVFHVFLHIFPYGTSSEVWSYLAMPFLSLFFPFIGIYTSRILISLKSEKGKVYYQIKGLDERIVVYRHMLGNASVLMLSTISSAFMEMLIAEIMVEVIFNWPGFGELLKIAVLNGDYKVVEGVLFTFSLIEIISELITDIIYGILDPRVTR